MHLSPIPTGDSPRDTDCHHVGSCPTAAQRVTADGLLATVLQHAPLVLCTWDTDGVVTSAAGRALAGVPHGRDLPGRSLFAWAEEVGSPELARCCARALAGETVHHETRVGDLLFETTYQPLLDEQGRTVGGFAVGHEVSTQRRSERRYQSIAETAASRLRASEQRYRSLVDSMSEVVVQSDVDGRWTFLSPAWTQLTGLEVQDSLGRRLIDEVHPDDRDRCRDHVAGLVASRGGRSRLPLRLRRTSGEIRHVELRAQPLLGPDDRIVGLTGTIDDVTERLQLERDLAEAQRLEAVGQLAAGIAHEINTPIQFIGDNLHFLADAFATVVDLLGAYRRALAGESQPWGDRRLHLDDAEVLADVRYFETEVPEAVSQALDGVQRVATIVRAMKAFGHPDGGAEQWADLNESIRNTLAVARNEVKYVADVVTDLQPLPPVLCHAGELNQVFLNIVVNAAQAIGEVVAGTDARGTITIRSRVVGDAVEVSISDTGPGIPEAIRHRVFEPFFTTKEVGRGTGQGLALAARIVRDKHGGSLTFDTTTGAGTTFTIRLPIGATGDRGA